MKKKSARGVVTVRLDDAVAQSAKHLEAGGAAAVMEGLRRDFPDRNPAAQGWWVRVLFELARQRRHADPVSALALLDQALLLAPDHVGALLMSASLQERLGDRQASQRLARQVLASDQAKPEQRLFACQLCGKETADADLIRMAHAAWQEAGSPLLMADSLLDMGLRAAAWGVVDEVLALLEQARVAGEAVAGVQSPRTHLLWCGDEEANLAVVRSYAARFKHISPAAPVQALSAEGRRLRVGYLSSDYRDHPTSRLLMGLLRHHDRTRVEVFLYCSGWDDGSALRKAVLAQAEHFCSVGELSDEQAAQRIRDDGIDVLVELNGPTRGNRLGVLAHRAAPVQIDYLGWPGSVGGQVVDYVVGDAYTVPAGRELQYPEKVIRLNRVYQVNDHAAMPRRTPPSRRALGLPEGVPVLGMFNQINKVRREVWQVWMEVLRRVPRAVLWLLDPGPLALENLRLAMNEAGIEVSRLLVAPRSPQEQHLARMQHCDLMLDPWPYGGHTTTADALFAGVPVVALRGSNFAGRVSGALLESAGLGALVQPDTAAYVDMAVRVLTDAGLNDRLRRFLRDEVPKTDVFKASDKARQFEVAFRHAYALAVAGKPPEHINLQPRQTVSQPVFVFTPTEVAATRPTLVLVCGPWSSGSSAVAGLLAQAGLQAPGPFVAVNDPRTPQTFEMLAFQKLLKQLASEETLTLKVPTAQALEALRQFRDQQLMPQVTSGTGCPPMLLKHGLAVLFIEQLRQLFDLRLVGVLRPLADIEATRQRRRWHRSMGRAGAEVIYSALMTEMVNGDCPFHLVRYPELMRRPEHEVDRLLAFCGWQASADQRSSAIRFVTRDEPVNAAGSAHP